MIGDIEDRVLQVDEFAGYVDGDDLAGTVADELLTLGKSVQQQDARRGRLAFADQIGFARSGTLGERHGLDRFKVVLRQSGGSTPSSDKRSKQ